MMLGGASAIAAAIALLAPAQRAEAAFPGANGVIAFDGLRYDPDEDPPDLSEIMLMRPDGTGIVRRTFDAGAASDRHDDPSFSGNGRVIVWEADEGDDEIWSMRTSGSGKRRLTNNSAEDRNPVISPNGKLVVFQRDFPPPNEDPQIWIMRADGTGQRLLSAGDGDDMLPAFSPDGRTVFFVSHRSGAPEIWATGVGGRNLRQVTRFEGPEVTQPDVSPNGKAVAFLVEHDIYTVRTDGSGLKRWTFTGGMVDRPSYSPDGRWFVWSEHEAGGGFDFDTEIMKRRLAGGPAIQVTDNDHNDGSPDWQPRNRCGGSLATIVGSIRRDVIAGTPRADVIVSHAGHDVVRGRRGNDRICGRLGRDRLHGHAGADRLYGQNGNDRLFGGRHRDRLFGGRGFDRLFGGHAFDRLRSGPGRDIQRQ